MSTDHVIVNRGVMLIYIKNLSDLIVYGMMKSSIEEGKVLAIVKTPFFPEALLKKSIPHTLIRCSKENAEEIYDRMIKILESNDLIALDAEDILTVCKEDEVYCEYCEVSEEQLKAKQFPREEGNKDKSLCLLHISGNMDVTTANDLCSSIDISGNVMFGCCFEENAPIRVFTLWKKGT